MCIIHRLSCIESEITNRGQIKASLQNWCARDWQSNPKYITWYDPVEGTPIISGLNYSVNGSVVTSILTLNNVTRDIHGKYICRASNHMGIANFTITLGEKTKPDEATDVNVTARSNTLIVTWKPGFDGGEKQSFYVEYLELSSGEQGATETTENEMIVIKELKPLTLYAVTVVSENVFGESRSSTVQQKTLDHLSASPPSTDVTGDESGPISKGIWIVGILAVLLMLPLATALLVVGYFKRKRKRVNSRRNIQRSNAAGGPEIEYTRISFSLPKEGRATQTSQSEEQEAVVHMPIYAVPQKDKKKRKQTDSKATKNTLYENVISADRSAGIHGTKDNKIADVESVHYTNIERSSQMTSEGIEVEGLSRSHESRKDESLTYMNLPHEYSRETTRQEGVYELLQEPIPPRDVGSLLNDERQRSNGEADVCERVPYENMPLIGSPGAKDVNTVSDDWCESVNGATSDREQCCEEHTYANQNEIESESNYELLE
ncbi:uncharacterized protein [Ptychodera flava]|uniref:uncharacterized protein n=1 Tax=Ptychodera flava TaxID=63121 RepID=UPI00396A5720